MTCRFESLRLTAVVCLILSLSACSSEIQPVEPFGGTQQRSVKPMVGVDTARALPVLPSLIGECSASVMVGATSGVPRYQHRRFSISNSTSSDARAVEVRFLLWGTRSGARLADVRCISAADSLAQSQTRDEIARMHYQQGRGLGKGAQSFPLSWGEPTLTCEYFLISMHVECAGVPCTPNASLLDAGTGSGVAANSVTIFSCANGCTIYGFEYYSCPSGGGGGQVVFPPSGGEGSSDCPSLDLDCILPLGPGDSALILQSWGSFDTTRTICKLALDSARAFFESGRVFRGNPSIADHPPGHSAEWAPGPPPFIHIDGDFLSAVWDPRDIASILAHEAWHAAGYAPHPESEQYPYTTYPYSQMASCAGIR